MLPREQEVYRRLKKGDPRVLEEIIDTHGITVYKLVARMLDDWGSSSDIEECCSDTFVALWFKRRQFDPQRASLRTWVLVLARYKALDYRRKLGRRREQFLEELSPLPGTVEERDPESLFLDQERRDTVLNILAELPDPERELIYRRYYLQESSAEIAACLKTTPGAVDNRLWRVRRVLKKHLEALEGGKVVPFDG